LKSSTWKEKKPLKKPPVVFFDFDNTITQEDVLDRIIQQFSISDEWQYWEDAWVRGEISTVQCLARQIAGVRASEAELIDFVANFQIDPHFASIVQWAANEHVDLFVVSDNFSCFVQQILSRQGLSGLSVMANELTFSENGLKAHFPFRSAACERCAHCKAVHFRRFQGRRKIYVGDGLSDVCPALAADVVFAKDSLADYLVNRGIPFNEFASLDVVADFLIANSRTSTESQRRMYRMGTQMHTQILVEGLPRDS
jgi:2-hydroxy-3-keto-5-methylthiopentenyl-1-phosphate phosphatase